MCCTVGLRFTKNSLAALQLNLGDIYYGEGIEMPKTMLVEVLPAVGNTAAPAEVGAIVTATGKLFVFNNPA